LSNPCSARMLFRPMLGAQTAEISIKAFTQQSHAIAGRRKCPSR
jgi:hypothetical protein